QLVVLFSCVCRRPFLHSFPTRRSSDLASLGHVIRPALRNAIELWVWGNWCHTVTGTVFINRQEHRSGVDVGARACRGGSISRGGDRKSTRLNSSHVSISYAVFCSKTKT